MKILTHAPSVIATSLETREFRVLDLRVETVPVLAEVVWRAANLHPDSSWSRENLQRWKEPSVVSAVSAR